MTIDAARWQDVLTQMGVHASVAADWSQAFANEIKPEQFSQGMDDVLAFVPQIVHETDGLTRLEENLNYSPQRLMAVWPSRFPTEPMASLYAFQPKKLAERVYGGRMGNGPEGSGDGWDFRGQGLVQFTGRTTYELLSRLCGQDLTINPGLVCAKNFGLEFARRWWEAEIPDSCLSDQVQVRRRVNGGAIGLEHCQQLADECRRAFA